MAGISLVCGALTYGGINTFLEAKLCTPGNLVQVSQCAEPVQPNLSNTAESLALQKVRPVQPHTWSHSAGHCLLVG